MVIHDVDTRKFKFFLKKVLLPPPSDFLPCTHSPSCHCVSLPGNVPNLPHQTKAKLRAVSRGKKCILSGIANEGGRALTNIFGTFPGSAIFVNKRSLFLLKNANNLNF